MFGRNSTILRGPKPLKTSGSNGVKKIVSTEGRLKYTQTKGLDEHFQDLTLFLAYDVIMTSQSRPKLKI